MEKNLETEGASQPAKDETLDIAVDSAAIRRMIEEIRTESDVGVSRSYNRTFNRHNR